MPLRQPDGLAPAGTPTRSRSPAARAGHDVRRACRPASARRRGSAEIDAAKHTAERVVAGTRALAPGTEETESLTRRQETGCAVGTIADVAIVVAAQDRIGRLVVAANATITRLHEQKHRHVGVPFAPTDRYPATWRLSSIGAWPERTGRDRILAEPDHAHAPAWCLAPACAPHAPHARCAAARQAVEPRPRARPPAVRAAAPPRRPCVLSAAPAASSARRISAIRSSSARR